MPPPSTGALPRCCPAASVSRRGRPRRALDRVSHRSRRTARTRLAGGLGRVRSVGGPRELACTLEQMRAFERLVGEHHCALERPLRIVSRRERRRSLGCAHEPVSRARLDLCGVRVVGGRSVRVQQVGGDHLGDLVGVDAGVSERYVAAARCFAFRPRLLSVSYATVARAPAGSRTGRARASGDRSRARASPYARARRAGAPASFRPASERSEPARSKVLPSTAASCRSCRSAGSSRRGALRSARAASRGRRASPGPRRRDIRSRPVRGDRGRAASEPSRPRTAASRPPARGHAPPRRRADPGTSPLRSSSIVSSGSRSRVTEVKFRRLAPQPACRSETSGRASVTT